ncbi:glucans biosynthesis glucosyltransferase MdoH [Halomonas sp. EGI 63088]|uniref:Glucans biosynthesis glucosyltransferase H n=1 Tax=Halomonas flagellata TaxID=2920385 RepID=A0ABS9RZP3_9GAMM|nr:glucans biosynthesis glucosyltransferase MdoH [Halomonas flagellata]MCH4565322.1 glucans biosynthesis glucosyltransferase MdoH [Halomonas flagellata]
MNSVDARRAASPALPPWRKTRRLGFALLFAGTTALGVWTMFRILFVGGISPLELVILGLFSITFGWITIAFWSAVIGFVLTLAGRDPVSLARIRPASPPAGHRSRTALVMPIHNEDVERVVAGLEATCRDLPSETADRRIEAFVLSDSTDEAIVDREAAQIGALQARLAGRCRVHYRHRDGNAGRKAGNLAEFCRRWGRHYDYLVVLDADSLMCGATITSLIDAMQANPRLGLLQTVPIPVRQESLFGRANQLAASLYAPMLAAGLSFWHADAANYFGHNAIIRTRAFMENCGLPTLPGKPPLGGDILSHDFVEAALLRRAGWQVQMQTDLTGSYEEMPSHLLDYAKRDRRWVQGNLQHLRLLAGRGLHTMSRLHFLFGALAYLSSLIWLVILAVSTVDALVRALTEPNFFTSGAQLFPDWPLAPPPLIMPLLAGTLAMLLMPKVLGLGLALLRRPADFGGPLRLLTSVLLEALFAMLIAPLMMVFHSLFVISVLSGRTVSWDPQAREGRAVPWRETWRHTWQASLAGLLWAIVTWWYTPVFFWWLTPVWLGLLLAAPLVRWSSSLTLGRALRRAGLLLAPSETRPPAVLRKLARRPAATGEATPLAPPAELPGEMPVQSFSAPQRPFMVPTRRKQATGDRWQP